MGQHIKCGQHQLALKKFHWFIAYDENGNPLVDFFGCCPVCGWVSPVSVYFKVRRKVPFYKRKRTCEVIVYCLHCGWMGKFVLSLSKRAYKLLSKSKLNGKYIRFKSLPMLRHPEESDEK